MSFILKILLGLFLIIFIWDRLTLPYKMIEQFNMFLAKPGGGKSMILAMIARKGIMTGHHVFSSEDINVTFKDKKTHKKVTVQTTKIDPKQLYRYKFPPYSWILIDEIGICFNNRKFKTFDERLIKCFKKYRHRHLTYFVCSQSTDCDATIRRIVSQYWLLEKYARVLIVARRLICKPVVVKPTADSPANIEDDFVEDPKLMRPVLGGMMLCWIPKHCKSYDSYEISEEEYAEMDIDLSGVPLPYEKKKIYHHKWDKFVTSFNRKKAQAIVACKTSLLRIRKMLRV